MLSLTAAEPRAINNLSDANKSMREGAFAVALKAYERLLNEGHSQTTQISLNIAICRKRLGRSNLSLVAPEPSIEVVAPEIPPVKFLDAGITVSLTTIESRLPHLHRVIESLHKQDVLPKEIRLYVSRDPYLLDKGISAGDPHIKELQKFPLLQVKWVNNTGPYRKIFPFLQEHFAHSVAIDQLFVTVDDDTLYPHTLRTVWR